MISKQEQEELDDYRNNAIQRYNTINLAGFESLDMVEGFEQRDKYMILMNIFKLNRFWIDTNYRNILSSYNKKMFQPQDIVTYKTKDYRVVCCHDKNVIIRNSKRMIDVSKDEVEYRNKELDDKSIIHIFGVLRRKVDPKIFSKASFCVTFCELFEIDMVRLLDILDPSIKNEIKDEMKYRR